METLTRICAEALPNSPMTGLEPAVRKLFKDNWLGDKARLLRLTNALHNSSDLEIDIFIGVLGSAVTATAAANDLLIQLLLDFDIERVEAMLCIHRHLRRESPETYAHLQRMLKDICEKQLSTNAQVPLGHLAQLGSTALEDLQTRYGSAMDAPIRDMVARTIAALANRPQSRSLRKAIDVLSTHLNIERDHFVYELIQNADDARATHWALELSERAVRASHDGRPLTSLDVAALCSIGTSMKGQDETGAFGIGFRSVYAITSMPRFECRHFRIEIDKGMAPHVVPGSTQDETTTLILPWRDDAQADALRHSLRTAPIQLKPVLLLTLRHLRRLTISVVGGLRQEVELLTKGDDVWARVRTSTGTESYLVIRGKLQSQETTIGIPVTDARIPEPLPVEQPTLYCGLPTKEVSGLRFWVNAPFKLTASRDALLADDTNRNLLGQIPQLLAQTCAELETEASVTAFLRLIPCTSELKGTLFGAWWSAELREAFRHSKLVLCADGALRTPDEVYTANERLQTALGVIPNGFLPGVARELHPVESSVASNHADLLRELGCTYITLDNVLTGIGRLAKLAPITGTSRLLPSGLANIANLCKLHEFLLEELKRDPAGSLRRQAREIPLFATHDGTWRRVSAHGDDWAGVWQIDPELKKPAVTSFLERCLLVLPEGAETDASSRVLERLNALRVTSAILCKLLASDSHLHALGRGDELVHLHGALNQIWTDTTAPEALCRAKIWLLDSGGIATPSADAAFVVPRLVRDLTKKLFPVLPLMHEQISEFPLTRRFAKTVDARMVLDSLKPNAPRKLRLEVNDETLNHALTLILSLTPDLDLDFRKELERLAVFPATDGKRHALTELHHSSHPDAQGRKRLAGTPALNALMTRLGLLDPQAIALRLVEGVALEDYLAACRRQDVTTSMQLLAELAESLSMLPPSEASRILGDDLPLLDRSGKFCPKSQLVLPDDDVADLFADVLSRTTGLLATTYSPAVYRVLRLAGISRFPKQAAWKRALREARFDATSSPLFLRLADWTWRARLMVELDELRQVSRPWVLSQAGTMALPTRLFVHTSRTDALVGNRPDLFVGIEVVGNLDPQLVAFLGFLHDTDIKPEHLLHTIREAARKHEPSPEQVYAWFDEALQKRIPCEDVLKRLKDERWIDCTHGLYAPTEVHGFRALTLFGNFRGEWLSATKYRNLALALGIPMALTAAVVVSFLKAVADEGAPEFAKARDSAGDLAPHHLGECIRACLAYLANGVTNIDGNWPVVPCREPNSDRVIFRRPKERNLFVADHPHYEKELGTDLHFLLVEPPDASTTRLWDFFSHFEIPRLSESPKVEKVHGVDVTEKALLPCQQLRATLAALDSVVLRLRGAQEATKLGPVAWLTDRRLWNLEIVVKSDMRLCWVLPRVEGMKEVEGSAHVDESSAILYVNLLVLKDVRSHADDLAFPLASYVAGDNSNVATLFVMLLHFSEANAMHALLDKRGFPAAGPPEPTAALRRRIHELLIYGWAPQSLNPSQNGKHPWADDAKTDPILDVAQQEFDSGRPHLPNLVRSLYALLDEKSPAQEQCMHLEKMLCASSIDDLDAMTSIPASTADIAMLPSRPVVSETPRPRSSIYNELRLMLFGWVRNAIPQFHPRATSVDTSVAGSPPKTIRLRPILGMLAIWAAILLGLCGVLVQLNNSGIGSALIVLLNVCLLLTVVTTLLRTLGGIGTDELDALLDFAKSPKLLFATAVLGFLVLSGLAFRIGNPNELLSPLSSNAILVLAVSGLTTVLYAMIRYRRPLGVITLLAATGVVVVAPHVLLSSASRNTGLLVGPDEPDVPGPLPQPPLPQPPLPRPPSPTSVSTTTAANAPPSEIDETAKRLIEARMALEKFRECYARIAVPSKPTIDFNGVDEWFTRHQHPRPTAK